MLTGRLQVHPKVRRHKHLRKPSLWRLDTEDIQTRLCSNETGTHTQSAPISRLNISLIFSHICQYSCITLLSSLASELLISLFVKMTLAGSIRSVPLSLRVEVSYPPPPTLSSSGRGEGISLWLLWQLYFSIFMTSRVSFHRCIKIPLTPFS